MPPPLDPPLELVSSKEYDRKDIKVSDLQANTKLAQRGEHQTRMAEVANSILTGGNILSLDIFFFSRRKAITPLARFKKIYRLSSGTIAQLGVSLKKIYRKFAE